MKTNILTLIITLVVGIILAGSLIAPVISDAQKTIGDSVTYENETAITLKEIDSGDVLHAYIDNGVKKLTLNGVEIETFDALKFADATLISNSFYMQVDPSKETNFVYLSSLESGGASWWSDCTIEFTATTLRFHGTSENGAIDETHTYAWGYVICNPADGDYCASVSGGSGYVNTTNDVILCGMYLSGENDTPYYYKDGVFITSQWSGTKSVNIDMELVSGTTDVYTATVNVDIGEENFTPYRIYLPLEVHGHESGGASYTLLGAIPIMVIVAILMLAVGAIAYRRAD